MGQTLAVEKIGGYVVLTNAIRVATTKQLFIKRMMDIVGSVIGLILCAIFTVTIGPIIYIKDPGPIFFSQERVGKNGKRFRLYKFRSMYMDAEERKADLMEQNQMQGLMFKMKDDPRIIGSGPDGTRHGIGWFIRKSSIDEFPQFWNVLKGDMSLVGTRPPTVDEWKQYEAHHRARLAVKPGITGLWQISGRSEITDFEEVVALDLQYMKEWSIGNDIVILWKTIVTVIQMKGQ
jgi:lipopolysaccharide/colanic/teichoic acid biosynthesis glycosyltransferase